MLQTALDTAPDLFFFTFSRMKTTSENGVIVYERVLVKTLSVVIT